MKTQKESKRQLYFFDEDLKEVLEVFGPRSVLRMLDLFESKKTISWVVGLGDGSLDDPAFDVQDNDWNLSPTRSWIKFEGSVSQLLGSGIFDFALKGE